MALQAIVPPTPSQAVAQPLLQKPFVCYVVWTKSMVRDMPKEAPTVTYCTQKLIHHRIHNIHKI